MRSAEGDTWKALLEGALPSPEAAFGTKQRVRRAVEEKVQQPHHRWVLTMTALAGACVTMVFFTLWANRSESMREWSRIDLTSARLVTSANAELRVVYDDARGTELALTSGVVFAHVQKRPKAHFVIVAKETRVEVTGTVFTVAVTGDQPVVSVSEGRVRVVERGQVRALTEGQAWPHGATVPELPKALQDLLLAPLPTNKGQNRSQSAPSTTLADEPAPTPTGEDATRAHPSASGPRPSKHVRHPAAQSPPESDFQRAKRLERAGQPEQAHELYATISASKSVHAEDAAFAMARLSGAGASPAEALRLCHLYRQRFPSGRYARAIDVMVLNLLLEQGDKAGALREANRFVQRYPDDPRAWRFRLLRAASWVEAGQCGRAALELDNVPDSEGKRTLLRRCLEPGDSSGSQ